MWATLPRGAGARIQMFHGVGGKYGFDAPPGSMRQWHRLFFVNERRLRNFVRAGAIDPASPAACLIGMPKVDCLVDGSLARAPLLEQFGLDPVAADGAVCANVVARLLAEPPRGRRWSSGSSPCRSTSSSSCTTGRAICAPRYSGGVDWMAHAAADPRSSERAAGHQREHHALPGRGRRAGDRPQLLPASNTCCSIARWCASTCRI